MFNGFWQSTSNPPFPSAARARGGARSGATRAVVRALGGNRSLFRWRAFGTHVIAHSKNAESAFWKADLGAVTTAGARMGLTRPCTAGGRWRGRGSPFALGCRLYIEREECITGLSGEALNSCCAATPEGRARRAGRARREGALMRTRAVWTREKAAAGLAPFGKRPLYWGLT